MSSIFQSKGIKRTLSVIFFLASEVPQLAPYSAALKYLGGLFGVVGIAHAGLAKK